MLGIIIIASSASLRSRLRGAPTFRIAAGQDAEQAPAVGTIPTQAV